MDKNKSIDGLTTRRSKKSTTSVSKSSKTSTPKSSTKHTATASKNAKTTPRPKSSPKRKQPKSLDLTVSQPKPQPKPNPTDINEDFLKPVQAFNFDIQHNKLEPIDNPSRSTITPEEDNKKKKAKKEKKPISKKKKIIIGIIITLVILLLGGAIWFILWGNNIIAKITNGQGNILDLFNEKYEPLKTDENGRTNILAFGTSGYNMNGENGDGTHDGAQLTDSIMAISLDQETGDLAMLSLPRDLKVSSTCTATGKVNEIYWCNNMEGDNEQTGAEALMTEVGDILGLDFQYYAHINWGSLVQIVDTLGGINVTLDEDIEDYGWTNAVFQAGVEYNINGEQALGLARARHGTNSGDFTRGASQQKILIGIKDKIFEKNLSLTDILNLANTLGDNLRTNFSIDEMKTLAHLSSDFDFNNMRQISLIEPDKLVTTGTINGISYVLPVGGPGNYNKIQSYVKKMFSRDPRSYENASILVLNASSTPGVASAEQSKLEQDGYNNIYVNDAPSGEYIDNYTLYSLTDSAPNTQKLLETKYNISAKTLDELPTSISRDYDFVLIIKVAEN